MLVYTLRLNFQTSKERIERLYEQKSFTKLTKEEQEAIINAIRDIDDSKLFRNRDEFEKELKKVIKKAGLSIKASVMKAILTALSERDEHADICLDKDGNPEPDPELRDYENVPLKQDIYEYFEQEVKPYVPDAWINETITDDKDGFVGKVGYEIPFTRYFYKFEKLRPSSEIAKEIQELEASIVEKIRGLLA